MKITHYLDSQKKTKKRGSNQYKSRYTKGFALIKVLAIIVLIGVIIYSYNAYQADSQVFKNVFMGKDVSIKADALTPEERAKIQKQAALAEEYIILTKQKSKLDAEYKASSTEIETKLEAIRKEKVSL